MAKSNRAAERKDEARLSIDWAAMSPKASGVATDDDEDSSPVRETSESWLSDFLGTKTDEKSKDLAKRIGLKVSLPTKDGGEG